MGSTVRWRSDFDKLVVTSNCERRGWQRWVPGEGEDWNFFWANVHTVKQIFNPDNGFRMGEHQMVNHFPNHYELTRKDLMVKNLRRYRKDLEKEGHRDGTQEGDSAGGSLDFLPLTYSLPADYALFVEEFRRFPHTTWIMKPTSRAQGKGIFLINKVSQVKKWMAQQQTNVRALSEPYIVSRYIDNPLLIGGRKFDLRLYVAVTSYRPLKAYMSELGFARFCNSQYSYEIGDLDNTEMHLTNVAVQKHGEAYNDVHGNKWPLHCFRLFLQGTHGQEATDRLFDAIHGIVEHSLKAVQAVMISDRHCFELYGFDVIVDDTLKPWLIEVNASPSLSTTTDADRHLKFKVISDVLNLVVPDQFPESRTWTRRPGDAQRRVGSFYVLIDQENEADRKREARFATARSQSAFGNKLKF